MSGAHPVVLFDGVCNLCSAAVRFLVAHDDAGTLRFAPLQSAAGESLLADCGLDPDRSETVVLVEGGECYTKSTAALRIARHLDGPWPALFALRVVPGPVRDAVYDLVARYRYDVFGRRIECLVPTDELRARFVTDEERPAENDV